MGDSRFAALQSDPRYRLPSQKSQRTAIDRRFERLFTDHDFRKNASVDRYGRRIKKRSGGGNMKTLYMLEKLGKKGSVKKEQGRPNLEQTIDTGNMGDHRSIRQEETSSKDLMREGFSASSSEEEGSSDHDSDSEAEVDLAHETAWGEQTESVPMGEVSHRIAAVNLDWDHIRASDIMAVARSFVPTGGSIRSVAIYPSEFGRERLEKEELEGPPREIFATQERDQDDSSGSSSEQDEDDRISRHLLNDQADDGTEFDTAKLRQYQLERLRYYYAILTFSSSAAAKAVYESLDGREYLTTANFFDLRFVGNDINFDIDRPREICDDLPENYKPNDFKTEALTHSRVRLTWDNDDTTRKEIQKRAFSRAELDENDLKAYIGSDDSDTDTSASIDTGAGPVQNHAKKEAGKMRLRAALGLRSSSGVSRGTQADSSAGGMQITFSSGLKIKDNDQHVFQNEPQDFQSTRENYIKKERERKQKRKEKSKKISESAALKQGVSKMVSDNASTNDDAPLEKDSKKGVSSEDLGFDDPFFTNPGVNTKSERRAKHAKRQGKDSQTKDNADFTARRDELDLLMVEDQSDNMNHFDMREVKEAEKAGKRKGNKKNMHKSLARKGGEAMITAFEIDATDPRFEAIYANHEYAIDPTNARFSTTNAIKALLKEGRKRKRTIYTDVKE